MPMTQHVLDVCYRYQKGDCKTLDSISCTFEVGKLNAVICPPCSGKTTLLSIFTCCMMNPNSPAPFRGGGCSIRFGML